MNNTWQKTFVMIKPDAVKRSLAGAVLNRFENAGLTLTAMKIVNPAEKTARAHYCEHEGQTFYGPLVNLLLSGPVICLCMEGAHVIDVVRKLVGATEPREALPGTIRGDYCHISYARSKEQLGVIANLIHASDSPESAERELALWFDEDDYVQPYKILAEQFM